MDCVEETGGYPSTLNHRYRKTKHHDLYDLDAGLQSFPVLADPSR